MIFAKSVAVGADKKLSIAGELGAENQHLVSLYTFIKESKPMKVDELGNTFSDKRLKLLINDVGTSLSVLGCVAAKNGGFLSKTECFIPDGKMVDHIIQNIRAELLEVGTVSDQMIALVSLLNRSNLIKIYFSKHENDQLKARLKEIKSTDSNKLVSEILDYLEALLATIVAIGAVH